MEDETTDRPRKRRSRAELKELMISAGVEVLEANGVETQISSVSYARVFEHLEANAGVRVTYGSVHERIWDSLQEYQLAVVERAGLWSAAAPDDAWPQWLRMAVAMTSQSDELVADTAAAGARNRYRAREARVGESLPTDTSADARAVLAHLSIAVRDGLDLRHTVTGDPEPTVMLPTGTDGALQEWDGHALAMKGIALFLATVTDGDTSPVH